MTLRTDLCPLKRPIRCVINNRFTYGVPLEDIFPPNDIHPQLKNLFNTICEKITYSHDWNLLYHILRYEQGSEIEQDKAIEILELCKHIEHMHIGLLFWASKTFLRCLPIPLLPFYTNGEFFSWQSLAKGCTGYTLNVRNKQRYMFMQITENLLRLPAANLLLLDYFFTFLRKLSIRDGVRKQRINKQFAVLLIKYYGLALFEQGKSFIKKEDKNYSPLLYYLVINWKVINYYIKQKIYSPIKPVQNKKCTGFFEPIDKSTQTSSVQKMRLETIFDDEILEIPSTDFKLNHVNEATQDKFDIPIKASTFIDSECQTDICDAQDVTVKKAENLATDAFTQCNSDIENDIFYSPNKEEFTKKSNSYEEIRTATSKSIKSKTKARHSIKDKLNCLQSSESSRFSVVYDPYIYDDYGEQMLIATLSNDDFEIDDDNDEDIFLSLNNTQVEQDKSQEDMKSKMSKLGWTYTPSADENDCPSKVNIFSPRPYKESPKNIQKYKICYDSEDKKPSEINEGKMEAIKSVPPKGLRNIISSGSVKIKLEFLRILGKGRDLKMKSNSSEEVISKIKYKKMNSTRSNLF